MRRSHGILTKTMVSPLDVHRFIANSDFSNMNDDTENQKVQIVSNYLTLDSVCYFLGQHGHGTVADRVRAKKYGKRSQLIKNGFLILLLKRHNLWDAYVNKYWPGDNISTVNSFTKNAKTWTVNQLFYEMT